MSESITTGQRVRHTNRKGDVMYGTVVELREPPIYSKAHALVEFDRATNDYGVATPVDIAKLVPGRLMDIDDTRGELIEHVEEWGKAGPQLWVRMKDGGESWIDIRSNLADQLYAHPELGAKARARATDNVHQGDASITGLSTDQARYILDSITGAGAYRSGAEVHLGADALDELAAMPEDTDGHFDGQYVWIGGSEYTVRGL